MGGSIVFIRKRMHGRGALPQLARLASQSTQPPSQSDDPTQLEPVQPPQSDQSIRKTHPSPIFSNRWFARARICIVIVIVIAVVKVQVIVIVIV